MKISQTKNEIRKQLFEKLSKIDGILSTTLVGSFVDKKGLDGISDIDTIVVCKKLSKEIYFKCISVLEKINLEKCGLNGYKILINSTFGPLKFDREKLVVIHLMIYDIKGHKKHVISSPFTCYDWERSKDYIGLPLKSIYPVGNLQFRDFVEARRSTNNYLSDLNNKKITFREYTFNKERINEIKKSKFLDEKHKGEFGYHIVKNLISNYLKLINSKNKSFSNKNICSKIIKLFPSDGIAKSNKFKELHTLKKKRSLEYPEETIDWAVSFVNNFQEMIYRDIKHSKSIYFIRHFKSTLNDNSFLGVGRDPSIVKTNVKQKIDKDRSIIFSSPMKRCIETVNELFLNNEPLLDNRLLEFNYGLAEGLSYIDISKKFPKIKESWDLGEDPPFPNGESTQDVFLRLNSFMNYLKNETLLEKDNIFVVTHNGVIRCLLGNLLNIEKKHWHRLEIPFGEPLEILFLNGNFHSNISRNKLSNIMKGFELKA